MFPEPPGRVPLAALLAALPPEWADSALPATIQQQAAADHKTKVIVLDDDPTGTQTVHDVLVVTDWSAATLEAALQRPEAAVFVLTNSRSVPLAAAQEMNRQIARNLGQAARRLGCDIDVISRSDSTLRGHFPGEVDALRDELERALGVRYHGYIIAPALLEAGRYTIDNVHWVRDGEWAVPAGQTEFARDTSFGYRSSDLRNWVAEKTSGAVSTATVVAVGHADLREGGPPRVAHMLATMPQRGVAIANVASYQDVAVLVEGMLQARAQGKRFIVRSAASFVRVRAGVTEQPLLTAERVYRTAAAPCGGLVVTGSYVQKSTEQLARALALPGVAAVELSVPRVLQAHARQAEIARAAIAVNELLRERDVILMTSRELVTGAGKDESLQIGAQVSAALVAVVRGIDTRPRFIVAKGGITSSDVATRGLDITQALVLGQIAPAVPVWQPAAGSRFPGVPYVVFPGNVGNPDTLAQVVQTLRRPPRPGDSRQ